jgi:hypothetical protein
VYRLKSAQFFLIGKHTLQQIKTQSAGKLPGNPIKGILVFLAVLLDFVSAPSSSAQIPQADPEKTLVVFYRVKNFKGGAIRFNVQHSEAKNISKTIAILPKLLQTLNSALRHHLS